MKILILLLYYDRPQMVRGALRSIRKAGEQHPDWELAFIDDSSPHPGRPVAEEELAEYLDQVRFYHTNTDLEVKKKDGSYVGHAMNQAIMESGAEIAIMLCDDDQLHPDYLMGLDAYFRQHPEVECCYSHVMEYDPLFENVQHVWNTKSVLNAQIGLIDPECQVDASQVAWRTRLNWEKRIWFAYPKTKCLDADFYWKIGNIFPEGITFSGMVGQYKGVHSAQLSWHEEEEAWTNSVDITNGRKWTPIEKIRQLVEMYIGRKNWSEAKRICDLGLGLHPADPILLSMDEFFYFEQHG